MVAVNSKCSVTRGCAQINKAHLSVNFVSHIANDRLCSVTVSSRSASILQARDDDRPVLHGLTKAALSLHHEVRCQAQPASTMLSSTSADYVTERALDDLWIICNACQVVPATHQSPVLTRTTVNIRGKDLHHVFFGIGWLGWRTSVAVGRHVDWFL